MDPQEGPGLRGRRRSRLEHALKNLSLDLAPPGGQSGTVPIVPAGIRGGRSGRHGNRRVREMKVGEKEAERAEKLKSFKVKEGWRMRDLSEGNGERGENR